MKNLLDNHVGAYEGQNIYDFDNEVLLNWYPKRLIMDYSQNSSLLELGLGHGYSTNLFSDHFERHLVLDGSSAVIDNFNKRFPKCRAEIMEVFFENFETTERFDAIVMGFVLEHVDNPVDIIKKFKKFLSPSGKMFVAVPNAEVLNRRLGKLTGLLPDIQCLSQNDILLGHKRFYTVKSLSEDISLAGFNIAKLEGIYLKPFATSQILSLNLDKKFIDALCTMGIDYPELSCGLFAELCEK